MVLIRFEFSINVIRLFIMEQVIRGYGEEGNGCNSFNRSAREAVDDGAVVVIKFITFDVG